MESMYLDSRIISVASLFLIFFACNNYNNVNGIVCCMLHMAFMCIPMSHLLYIEHIMVIPSIIGALITLLK